MGVYIPQEFILGPILFVIYHWWLFLVLRFFSIEDTIQWNWNWALSRGLHGALINGTLYIKHNICLCSCKEHQVAKPYFWIGKTMSFWSKTRQRLMPREYSRSKLIKNLQWWQCHWTSQYYRWRAGAASIFISWLHVIC